MSRTSTKSTSTLGRKAQTSHLPAKARDLKLTEARKLPLAKLDHWAERFAVPRVDVVQAAVDGRFGLYFMIDGFIADLPNPSPGHPLQLRPYRGYLLSDQATLEAILDGEACHVQEAYEPGGGHVYVELAPNGTLATPLNIRMDDLFAAGDDVAAQASPGALRDAAVSSPWCAPRHQHATVAIDHAKRATRQQLIDAFGKFTNMDMSWFLNLKDAPRLRDARKVIGAGGHKHTEPLFCPFEVMQWLIDPRRGKGLPLSKNKGWELLANYFPRAHAPRSVLDPREDA
ncbi:hypothetical protein [Comamonas odontotermitis]|uniref:hypothetical protein n=1 Tax=Comamonas odontotermitis TaxID=379895 RepID=UPI001CC611F9|nr:hypothetical protein [Comamonas odontotermitis]UBB17501.1 hypothetical protein LAD35_02235 [Comamonas odontotermitis]